MNKKRLIVFGTFLLLLFCMITFASGPTYNVKVKTRTVTFIDGFDNSEISSEEVEVGKDAKVPANPYHEDYVFTGWYEGEDRVFDFTNISNNLTVVARYGEDLNNNGEVDRTADTYYTVTFLDYNGVEIDTQEILSGMSAVAPEVPNHPNRVFVGWSRAFNNVQEDIEVRATYRVTTDPIIEPEKAPKYADDLNNSRIADEKDYKYSVAFNANGEGTLDGTKSYSGLLSGMTFEQLGIVIPAPKAEIGSIFVGWNEAITNTTKVTSNKTYIATFEKVTITYSPNSLTNTDVTATITFPVDGVTITNNGGSNKYVFTDNGSFTFEFTDKYGNIGSAIATVIYIDKIDPVFEDLTDGDFFKDNVYVKVIDDHFDKLIVYNEDTGIEIEYTNPEVLLTEEGTYVLEAHDLAGNTAKISITIDKTPPTVKVNLNRAKYVDSGATFNSAAIPELEAHDKYIASVAIYDMSGNKIAGPWAPSYYSDKIIAKFNWYKTDGTYQIIAIDKAGNASTPFVITIDDSKPVTEMILPEENAILNAKDVKAKVTSTDNHGLAKITANIYDSTGTFVTGSSTPMTGATSGTHEFDFGSLNLPDGIYTMRGNSQDLAGNISNTINRTFEIDSTAPTIDAIITKDKSVHGVAPIVPEGTWIDSEAQVSIKASDAGSGIAKIEFKKNDGTWKEYSEPAMIKMNATTTLTIRVIDRAGNVSPEVIYQVNIN